MLFGFFESIVEPIYSPTRTGNSANLILSNAMFQSVFLITAYYTSSPSFSFTLRVIFQRIRISQSPLRFRKNLNWTHYLPQILCFFLFSISMNEVKTVYFSKLKASMSTINMASPISSHTINRVLLILYDNCLSNIFSS